MTPVESSVEATAGQMGEEPTTPERTYDIAVLARALDVLDVLAACSGPLGTTEIARQLGTTKSATFRILVNLERRGFVRKNAAARFLLGPRLITLGARARADSTLLDLARPYLERLNVQFRETANLGILDQHRVLYLDMVESPQKLRMASSIGVHDCLHSTALGKAILAFLSPAEQERVLLVPLEAKTSRTQTDPERLRGELAEIRRTGVATEVGENEPDARCIGAPVFDHRAEVFAALSLSGPASRMSESDLPAIEQAVVAAARALTRDVGGVWPG